MPIDSEETVRKHGPRPNRDHQSDRYNESRLEQGAPIHIGSASPPAVHADVFCCVRQNQT